MIIIFQQQVHLDLIELELDQLNLKDISRTVACIAWYDNSPVLVISNMHVTPEPSTPVKSWNQQIREYIYINRPNCISMNNKHMGEWTHYVDSYQN